LALQNSSGRTCVQPLSRNTARGASRIKKLTARPQSEARAFVTYFFVIFFFFFFMAMA
jgi:hypothetical protein